VSTRWHDVFVIHPQGLSVSIPLLKCTEGLGIRRLL